MPNSSKRWLLLGLWMTLIFLLSTDLGSSEHTSRIIEPLLRWLDPQISAAALERAHFIIRKCAHFSEYAVLAMLALRAVRYPWAVDFSRGYWRAAGWALLITAFYASSDEFHQSFVPGRTATPIDVLIDTSGGLAALILTTGWGKFRSPPAGPSEPDRTGSRG